MILIHFARHAARASRSVFAVSCRPCSRQSRWLIYSRRIFHAEYLPRMPQLKMPFCARYFFRLRAKRVFTGHFLHCLVRVDAAELILRAHRRMSLLRILFVFLTARNNIRRKCRLLTIIRRALRYVVTAYANDIAH